MTLVHSATVHAPSAVKPPLNDDRLPRRWERIALEVRS